jgi:hypothetical protein
MRANQTFHLVQWLIIIVIMVIFLVFLPFWIWVKLTMIGAAFLIGFLLRILGKYPGSYEPPLVDVLTSVIAFLSIIMFLFLRDMTLRLIMTILVPFIILIPHFVYIVRKKDIEPPGIKKMLAIIINKTQSRQNYK